VKQVAVGLAFMALAAFVWFQARGFPELPEGHPGPALFPNLVAAGLFLAGAALAVTSLMAARSGGPEGGAQVTPEEGSAPDDDGPDSAGRGVLRIVLVLAAVGAYPLISPATGFVASVGIVGVVVALLLRARPVAAVTTAVAGTLVIYLLFTRLLGVPL